MAVSVDLKDYLNDPANVVQSIELKSGPGSVTNGVYSWTPNSEGNFDVTVVARTSSGLEFPKTFRVVVTPSGRLTIYVTQFNSGPAVSNAQVVVRDGSGSVRGTGTTDSDGKASFLVRLDADTELLNVFISKPTHARTAILGLMLKKDETFQINTTLRKATYGQTTMEVPISVNVELYTDSSKTQQIDPSNVTQDDIYVRVEAQPLEFNEGVNIIYAKVGGVPGTSFFTSPRLYVSGSSVLEGSLSVKEFDGLVPLIVDVYDFNDNKVEKIIWLNVVRTPGSVTPYLVERRSSKGETDLIAYTRNGAIEFYSKPPVEKHSVAGRIFGSDLPSPAPTASPDDKTNLWIEVYWLEHGRSSQSGSTDAPKAYRVYRSFDGVNFEPIATIPSAYNYYKDSSPLLKVGQRTWYAVAALYDGFEATKTVIGSVTPLPMFEVEYIGPLNGATNVSRDPTFSWQFKGLEAFVPSDGNTSLTYYYDIWLYDLTVNDYGYYSIGSISIDGPIYSIFDVPVTPDNPNPVVEIKFSDYHYDKSDSYWVDFAAAKPYPFDKLQANKTYAWGNELLVAELYYDGTDLSDPEDQFVAASYAIRTDYAEILVLYGVEPEIYHTFTTGTE